MYNSIDNGSYYNSLQSLINYAKNERETQGFIETFSGRREKIADELSKLKREREELHTKLREGATDMLVIAKRYRSFAAMKRDNGKDPLFWDPEYDSTDRNLWQLIRIRNEGLTRDDQLEILERNLRDKNPGATESEFVKIIDNHLQGGRHIVVGDIALVTRDIRTSVFVRTEDNKWREVESESDILDDRDLCLQEGHDIGDKSLRQFFEKNKTYMINEECLTKE